MERLTRMLFRGLRERDLRMIWRVERDDRKSFLVGTAHFFPYSFKKSLRRLSERAEAVLFEGPLDQESMKKVVHAGVQGGDAESLLAELDESIVAHITEALFPPSPARSSVVGLELFNPQVKMSVSSLIEGMKPWMAFFSIYSRFVEQIGWRFSVDMEAYTLARQMGKNVVFMETIEEQIEVLESLSRPQIIDFLKRFDHWKSYTRDFVKWYLEADLERFASNPYGFPTRNPRVIDERDRIFYERMQPYLAEGNAVAFVGSPHVVGISRMLKEDKYAVEQCDALGKRRPH